MKSKTAIVLGATGLTGSLLLERLVADEQYSSIRVFSRRTTGNTSPKVQEYIGDVLQLESFSKDFTADVVFCCIGTTSGKTKDRKLYHDIDFGIPVKAARMVKENNIPCFVVMSSIGANSKSRVFYTRTKGEMEEAVLSQGIPHTYILRPSLILGARNERRITESIGGALFRAAGFLMKGRFRKYRAIESDTIAAAMVHLEKEKPDLRIISSDLIEDLGN